MVTTAVGLVKGALEAAAATPSVQRLVLTSSSAAAGYGEPSTVFDLSTDSWNTAHVQQAWAPPPYGPDRAVAVYSASKTAQEQEAWKFVQERRPGFVLNAVLPDFVCGRILSVENQGYPSSIGTLKAMWDGDNSSAAALPLQYEVDAEDIARLHVAAMLHPDAQGERVFGYAYRKNLTNLIQYLRELYPDKQFQDPPANEGEFLANVLARPRAEELLKWVKGDGWTGYKESLKLTCDTML